MLNEQRVLSYVKDNLGWPFMHLELTDEKIIEYIKDNTILKIIQGENSRTSCLIRTLFQ